MQDEKLSKALSYLLRHGAEKEGFTFDDGGFLDVQKVLQTKSLLCYTINDIKRVVEENDKKRFSLRVKENKLQIRANQGHTLRVPDHELLSLLTVANAPRLVYHGTYCKHLKAIREKGLCRMKRNHIHFTAKLPGESGVTSGMRWDCEIFIVVDVFEAIRDGYKFYVSDNEVILSPGNEFGVIPPRYFKEIWKLFPRKLIV